MPLSLLGALGENRPVLCSANESAAWKNCRELDTSAEYPAFEGGFGDVCLVLRLFGDGGVKTPGTDISSIEEACCSGLGLAAAAAALLAARADITGEVVEFERRS